MARSKAKPKRRSRTPDTITAAMLTGACAYQVELFNHHWPNGLRITLATVVTAAHQGFDLSWAAERLLPASALAEYYRVRAAALAEYERVTAAAWAEYERVTAAALFSAWKRHGLKPLETRWSSVPNRRPGLGAAMDAGPAY